MGSPAGENEDFNISAARELTIAELAGLIWEACGEDPRELRLKHLPTFEVDVQRRWPSVQKARDLLGWEARVELRDGSPARSPGCASRSSRDERRESTRRGRL